MSGTFVVWAFLGLFMGIWKLAIVVVVALVVLHRSGLRPRWADRLSRLAPPTRPRRRVLDDRWFVLLVVVAATAVATWMILRLQIAGISVRFDLPVADARDMLELRVRIVARSTRVGGTSLLRAAIYNPVDERFDTAVELPAATAATTLAFATSSLRHLTTQKQLRVSIGADLDPGDRATLRVDLFEVVLVARAP